MTSNLNCKFIEFRIIEPVLGIRDLEKILLYINSQDILNFSFCFKLLKNEFSESESKQMLSRYEKLFKIIIYNQPEEKVIDIGLNNYGNIIMTRAKELSKSCGVFSETLFTINVPHFTESQHYNTCLNRKISIDAEGNIKNCPSMSKSYGNIRDTKLIDVVNSPDFQKVWHIKKDEITKCKDCEFRHICTDCRAYIENPEDQYSAPLKCGYNPYTCEWEEWSSNPLKQNSMEYYGMQELVKKENQ